MSVFGAIGEFAIGDIGLEYVDESEFAKFIRSAKSSRFILQFSAVRRQGGYLGEALAFSIGEGPIGDIPGGDVVLDEKTYFLSDGKWIGKPSDPFYPNKETDPRIVSTSDIERTMPMSPEASRRGEITVGGYEFTNVDSGLDELIAERSIANRVSSLYYGPARAPFSSYRLVAEMNGVSFESTLDTIKMRVVSTTAQLDSPLHLIRYQGTGGREGDLSLKDTVVPVCYGECFNITPVLERADLYIYRVHDSAMLAVDSVKEAGLPFVNDGDVDNYNQLVAATVPSGHYLTCLSEGRFRAGFSGAPAGLVTCDVRGDVDASGYTDRTGPILLKIAINRAKISTNFLDVSIFNQLPTGAIGYYSPQEERPVSQIFDDLLRGINGWYGTRRNRLLRVDYILPPEGRPVGKYLVTSDCISIEEMEVSQPPRYEQSVIYRKNWTPMTEDQVSLTLDADERAALLSTGQPLRSYAADTKVRDRNSIRGETITTYFRDATPAQDVLDRLMALYRESRRQFRVRIDRQGYLLDLQTYVNLSHNRLGLSSGLNTVITTVRDDGKSEQVELILWG